MTLTTNDGRAVEKISAQRLTTEHEIVDVYGGTHAVARIVERGRNRHVTRTDGWRDTFRPGETVLVVAEVDAR
jgi:hypothetical protein